MTKCVKVLKNFVKIADIIAPNFTEATLGEKYVKHTYTHEYVGFIKETFYSWSIKIVLTGVSF